MQHIEVIKEEDSGVSCKTGMFLDYSINVQFSCSVDIHFSVYSLCVNCRVVVGVYHQYTMIPNCRLIEGLYTAHALNNWWHWSCKLGVQSE